MGFRSDINGLRAIAVLSVLLFHFGVPAFSGGFVGVDIFFVISGYLMTGIITGRMDKHTFSIANFYLDRGRRIIPPLAVLIVSLLVFGFLFLLPQDYLALGKAAAASITFLSNILFYSQSGYFAPTSKMQWLLHTWSLSVEWQFYLLYPLFVLGIVKVGERRSLLPSLTTLLLVSFALSLWLMRAHASAAFYLLPPRAWEMVAGGLVLLLPGLPDRFGRAGQIGGLLLILASIETARANAWPGPWALLPVLGTALVIAARRTNSRVTGNAAAAWLGRNSYSIYLWHWPLAVLAERASVKGTWFALPYFVGSLILGHLSWRFVERGRRHDSPKPHIHTEPTRAQWLPHVRLIAIVSLIAIAGSVLWKARGLPMRYSAEVRAIEADAMPSTAYPGCFPTLPSKPACIVGPRSDRSVGALVGDSHADADVTAVVAAMPKSAAGGLTFAASPACAPLIGGISSVSENRCDDFLRAHLEPLTRPRITPVILISYWGGLIESHSMVFGSLDAPFSLASIRQHLIQTSCALAKVGPTYIMLPTPSFPFEVAPTLQARLIADPAAPDITIPLADHRRQTAVISDMLYEAAHRCGVILLDPIPYICPDGQNCMGSYRHRALFRDKHHMTAYGARMLEPLFRPVFQ